MLVIFKDSYYQYHWSDSNQILQNDKDLPLLFAGGPKMYPTNPRWRMVAILKKMINRNISATFWPILMNFCLQCFDAVGWATGKASGMVMCLGQWVKVQETTNACCNFHNSV